ncbi:MAG: TonB-dependent receptor [Saprospiraceae bacterium]
MNTQIAAQIIVPTDTVPANLNTLKSVTVRSSMIRNITSVSSINQSAIEKSISPTIEPLLNSTPGIWMQSGALNTNRISIRGVGYREPFATTGIKVYLNEIPLTNGVGESSIEDIHPGILKGIDIWRGPASTIWGSGLGGAIHLQARAPIDDLSTTELKGGSFGNVQFDQSINYAWLGKTAMKVHYQYLQDEGFRDNNRYQKHSGSWLQFFRINEMDINSFLHFIDLKAFIPSSLNKENFENDPTAAAPAWEAVRGNEDYKKWIAGISGHSVSENNLDYKGSVFATSFQSDEVRPFNILEEGSLSYGTRHRFLKELNQDLFLNAGLEYYGERYKNSTFKTLEGGVPGDKLNSTTEYRNSVNLFLHSEFDISSKWSGFVGLHSYVSFLSGQDIRTTLPFSLYPSLGIRHKVTDHFSVSASVSRGYTALSFDDLLNSSGIINEDIKPESGWNKEISATISSKNDDSHIKATLFHMNIHNTIITRRIDEDQFEKINGGSSVHRGVELEWRLKLGAENLFWSGAYTFNSNYFQDFVDGGNDYSGNHLPGSPDHRSYNQLSYDVFQKFRISAEHHWLSAVYLTDDNTKEGEGYQLLHLSGQYTLLRNDHSKLSLNARIHNLLDEHYSPMFQINALGAGNNAPRYYYPGKPRSFYVGLVFNQSL